jgi:hypothetical protein
LKLDSSIRARRLLEEISQGESIIKSFHFLHMISAESTSNSPNNTKKCDHSASIRSLWWRSYLLPVLTRIRWAKWEMHTIFHRRTRKKKTT